MPKREANPTRSWQLRWIWQVALLLVLGEVAYVNALDGQFTFDDQSNIIERPEIRQFWPPAWFHLNRWFGVFTLVLNYAWGGFDPWGYHLVNVCVHLAAGLTLFALVSRTLKLPRFRDRFSESGDWLAFAVAAIWIVHPLNTQSVTYVIQRFESMMGLCFLLCMYCVLRFATSVRWKFGWGLGAILSFFIGMGCKEVMAMAALVIPVFWWIFLRDANDSQSSTESKTVSRKGARRDKKKSNAESPKTHPIRLLINKWWIVVGFALPFCWFLPRLYRGFTSPAGQSKTGFAYEGITSWDYAMTQFGVITHYLRLSFWPSELCIDYDWQPAQTAGEIVPPMLLVVTLLLASFLALRYRPPIGFVGLSFFLILAPTSSIMPIADLAFEHRMYLPLTCVVTLTVFGCYELGQRLAAFTGKSKISQAICLSALACAIAGLTGRTIARNEDYVNPVGLWESAARIAPKNGRAHANLGDAFLHQKRHSEAQTAYEKAVRLGKGSSEVAQGLIQSLMAQGNEIEARNYLDRMLVEDPNFVPGHHLYGDLLLQQGDEQAALEQFETAVQINPQNTLSHFLLANCLLRMGDESRALAAYETSLQLHPRFSKSRINAAWLLAASSDPGIRDGQKALAHVEELENQLSGPAPVSVLDLKAAALASAGSFDEATKVAQRAAQQASSLKMRELAREIRKREAMYARGEVYVREKSDGPESADGPEAADGP